MKIRQALIFISAIVISASVFADTLISLTNLTKTVSERNYHVQQEAERTYQAKLAIDQARGNLLPKLNIWQLAKVIIDPMALLDIVQDVAPFLIPGNWFRLKETEILYAAQKEGYRALWANELSAARTLYFRVMMDHGLYDIVGQHLADLTKAYEIAQSRFLVGLEKVEIVRTLEMQKLKLEEDKAQLELLLQEELNAVSFALGLPDNETIVLAPLPLIKPSDEKPLAFDAHIAVALNVSPESKQYDQFLKVIPLIKKEVMFSILGVSDISRGVAGGIFDGIAIPNGLGFSTASTIRIIKTQKQILENQRMGIIETLKRQLKNVVNTYNRIIDFYPNSERRESLADANIETINYKIVVGEKVDLLEVADALETRTLSRAAKLEQIYRFRMNQDRFMRMVFSDEYARGPVN